MLFFLLKFLKSTQKLFINIILTYIYETRLFQQFWKETKLKKKINTQKKVGNTHIQSIVNMIKFSCPSVFQSWISQFLTKSFSFFHSLKSDITATKTFTVIEGISMLNPYALKQNSLLNSPIDETCLHV